MTESQRVFIYKNKGIFFSTKFSLNKKKFCYLIDFVMQGYEANERRGNAICKNHNNFLAIFF